MVDEIVQIDRQMPQQSGVVMPVASADEMHNAMVAYQQLKEAVLDKTDMQDAGRGQTFVKKSGWAKLAIAFGVSTAIKQDYPKMFYSESGALIRAEFVIVATAPNGRFAEGWGSCSASEGRFRGNAQKIDHDLPATAETRARNRAYAALFGHGEVSYEEVKLLGIDDDATEGEVITPRRQEPREAPLDLTPDANGFQNSQYSAGSPQARAQQTPIPKASPNKPASANQLATVAKLSRLLGHPEEPDESWTSAQASERITDLSREYNERKGSTPARRGA